MRRAPSVGDVMNPDIMTVPDDMSIADLVRYLAEREISGAPVVDGQGHLIGVVSMTDIGRHFSETSDLSASDSSAFYRDTSDEVTLEDLGQRYVEARAATVRDVMTPAIHQVPASAPVAEAARMMIEQHVHRLVVTKAKEPVGIITTMDLLRLIAEPPARA